MTDKHKHYQIAYNAHRNTSFSPERRAESLCVEFDNDIKKLKALNVPDDKITHYESLWIDWMHKKSRCISVMITGPANFPARRAEKANNAEYNAYKASIDYFDKLISYAEKEKYYAEHPEARQIKSGDSDAEDRLRLKIAKLKANHDKMLATNKILRKKPVDRKALLDLYGDESIVDTILTPDCYGGIGFASYALNNNRANIKQAEDRLKTIEKRKDQGTQEINVNGVRVIQNSDDMRLQLFFDGKPEPHIIKLLKSNAFKWAPSKGAWQRQLTNAAIYAFKTFVKPELEKGVKQ